MNKRYNVAPYIFHENLNASLFQRILEVRLPSVDRNDWVLLMVNDSKHKALVPSSDWSTMRCLIWRTGQRFPQHKYYGEWVVPPGR
ncbi:hypothetical protein EON65_30110 [archaeon]|nr:MAG: hypothetical protein EON65_30110 [archaeon]